MNPLIVWEVVFVQNTDKVVSFDKNTKLYNVNVGQVENIAKSTLIKIVHIKDRKVMLVFVTKRGKALLSELFTTVLAFEKQLLKCDNIDFKYSSQAEDL